MKNSCINCSSLTGNSQVSFMEFTRSCRWRRLFYIIPSHLHHQHPLYPCHTEPPRVHRPVSLHRAFPGSGIFPLPCQATCISSCQGGELLLNTKAWLPTLCFWESLCCLPSHPPGRVSHSLPELEQDLIHSFYNTSFILFTCLSPQHDAELLGTRLCYSSPPLAPSPVPGTFTKTFWSPEKFL